VRTYAEAMAQFAAMPMLPMWVARLPLERLIDQRASANLRCHLEGVIASALRRDSRQAVRKLCESDGSGGLRFRHQPPLIWRFEHLPEQWMQGLQWQEWVAAVKASYISSLAPALQHLLSQFRLVDSAFKAVGVGSVGTRCGISLFVGEHPDDILVLQVKQANASVLAPYLDRPAPEHQGQRVVQGQRLLQTASDSFLGWCTNPAGEHLYGRSFRDWKGSVDVTQLDADGLKDYGKLCAWTLAKAHARSGDRRAIAAHIGDPRAYGRQLLEPAIEHADLAVHDHALLLQGIASGRISTSEIF
jgi:hypothetical protein